MWESLNKIIKLIEKTGDKCVILDENKQPFVIMGLSEYEKLNFKRNEVSNLSQGELLDKINREIAVWRAVNKEKDIDLSSLDITEEKKDNKVDYIEEKNNPSQIVQQTDNFSSNIDNVDIDTKTEVNKDNDEYFIEPLD